MLLIVGCVLRVALCIACDVLSVPVPVVVVVIVIVVVVAIFQISCLKKPC